MKTNNLILITIFICMSYACTGTRIANNACPKTITIIFDSIKNNYDTLYFETGADLYTSNPVLLVKLSPDKSEKLFIKDTIEIELPTNIAVITHKYAPVSYIDFILEAGDTAFIKYINEIPFISVSNRRTKHYDLNYDYYIRLRYGLTEGMQIKEIMINPSIYVYKKWIKGDKSYIPSKVWQEFYPKIIDELNDESLWLDSLFRSDQISETEYHFYKERNNYTILDLELGDKTLQQLETKLIEYNDSLYRNDWAGFYKNHYYSTGIVYINKTLASSKNGDMTEIYDYIENNQNIVGKLSQDLLEVILRNILKKSAFEKRQLYFNKFSQSVSDTTLINSLAKEYENLLNPENALSDDLILLNTNNERVSFSEVLNQCAGKKVYVDIWASWCAPCIKEMDFSKQLRDNPLYKDVVFIYLALNDKEENWRKILEKVHLNNHVHNYLILNSNDSPFVKQYEINTLPRYMVFDKDGKIYNADAPTPSNSKIYNVLVGE